MEANVRLALSVAPAPCTMCGQVPSTHLDADGGWARVECQTCAVTVTGEPGQHGEAIRAAIFKWNTEAL